MLRNEKKVNFKDKFFKFIKRITIYTKIISILEDLLFILNLSMISYFFYFFAINSLTSLDRKIILCVVLLALFYILLTSIRKFFLENNYAEVANKIDSEYGLEDEFKSAFAFANKNDNYFLLKLKTRANKLASILSIRRILKPKLKFPSVLFTLMVFSLINLNKDFEFTENYKINEQDFISSIIKEVKEISSNSDIDNLDKNLRVYQNKLSTKEDLLVASNNIREAYETINYKGDIAESAIKKISEILSKKPNFEEVTTELEKGNFDKALFALRELIKEQSDLKSENNVRTDRDIDFFQKETSYDLEKKFEETISNAMEIQANINEEALNQILETIEEANDIIDTRDEIRKINNRNNDFIASSSQRDSLTASRFDNQVNSPDETTPSPITGNTRMSGGSMFRQAALARNKEESLNKGNSVGSASGDSLSESIIGDLTDRLDDLNLVKKKVNINQSEKIRAGYESTFYVASEKADVLADFKETTIGKSEKRVKSSNNSYISNYVNAISKDYFLDIHKREE